MNGAGRLVVLGCALAIAACSTFSPEVGPIRGGHCAPSSAYGLASPPAGTIDPRCVLDGGFVADSCEACEASNCCAPRVACYDDIGCDCADQAMDACTDGDAGASMCLSAFAASGALAKARVDCKTAMCKDICGL